MVKKGPCFHCGINSTPIWRNGPPEKPVLCNACGSRYRHWETLDNYTPKHAQYLCNLKIVYCTDINVKNELSSENFNLPSIVSPQGTLNPSLWNSSSIPSRKRTQVVQKKMTQIQKFKKKMLSWWKQDKKKKESSSSSVSASASAPEDEDLIAQRVNKLIPEDEIGPGGKLLPRPDQDYDVICAEN